MARCETCGNDYKKTFQIVTANGEAHVFDCYECAIHSLAPACEHCGCKIIGHGVESGDAYFCCHHCQEMAGKRRLKNRSSEHASPH